MPVAVVNEEPVRYDLKSCPEGYVLIKRMSYGEKLERRKWTSKMEVLAERGSNSAKSTIELFKEEQELYDFAHCIAEHNLTDADGRPLLFSNPMDVKRLAGRIAEEIGTYIDKENNFEEDAEVKNFSGESVTS